MASAASAAAGAGPASAAACRPIAAARSVAPRVRRASYNALCQAGAARRCTRALAPSASRGRASHVAYSSTPFAGEEYSPFPFTDTDYVKTSLAVVQTTDLAAGNPKGSLILMKLGTRPGDNANDMALSIQVGGDTLWAIASLLQGRIDRPFTLDLMWSMFQRWQEESDRNFTLLHVAVVELRGAVFIGRLFFGDNNTGEILWDCDCRPSDGCWMALKAKCPIYIHHSIWSQCAVLATTFSQANQAAHVDTADTESIAAVEDTESMMSQIRREDPDAIKRLKREMEVAVAEEDYATAARIRDHPYMQLYARIVDHRREGREQQAEALMGELIKIIAGNEA